MTHKYRVHFSDLSSALSGSSFLRKEPHVTRMSFVSPVLHDGEPKATDDSRLFVEKPRTRRGLI